MKFFGKMLCALMFALCVNPAGAFAEGEDGLYEGWGYGFQLGGGGVFPTSSLRDDFKGAFIFTGGLTGEYRNVRLKADVAFGQPSLKNDNPYAVYDTQLRNLQINGKSSASLLMVGIQAGYTVARVGRLSITPMVGGFFSRIGWTLNNITWSKDAQGVDVFTIANSQDTHESHFSWMASIDFDIKVHNSLTHSLTNSDRQAYYTSSVRISPFIARASYKNLVPAVKGNYIGITVAYSGMMHLLNY